MTNDEAISYVVETLIRQETQTAAELAADSTEEEKIMFIGWVKGIIDTAEKLREVLGVGKQEGNGKLG